MFTDCIKCMKTPCCCGFSGYTKIDHETVFGIKHKDEPTVKDLVIKEFIKANQELLQKDLERRLIQTSTKTKQPVWRCLANIGDANPFEYGGEFIMIDTTGVYAPELWVYDYDRYGDRVIQVVMARCFVCEKGKGVSDNSYHKNEAAWFGDREAIGILAGYIGYSHKAVVAALTYDNVSNFKETVERAHAWSSLLSYYGADELCAEALHWSRLVAKQKLKRLQREAKEWAAERTRGEKQ